MINSTNTVNIDGAAFDGVNFKDALKFKKDDNFSLWVVRPLVFLTMAGLGVGLLFASAFLFATLLVALPLIALTMWVMRTKIERDQAAQDPIVATQEKDDIDLDSNMQTAN